MTEILSFHRRQCNVSQIMRTSAAGRRSVTIKAGVPPESAVHLFFYEDFSGFSVFFQQDAFSLYLGYNKQHYRNLLFSGCSG